MFELRALNLYLVYLTYMLNDHFPQFGLYVAM